MLYANEFTLLHGNRKLCEGHLGVAGSRAGGRKWEDCPRAGFGCVDLQIAGLCGCWSRARGWISHRSGAGGAALSESWMIFPPLPMHTDCNWEANVCGETMWSHPPLPHSSLE